MVFSVGISPAEGVRISTEAAGEGPPLILVPGAGGHRSVWDPLWPRLTTVCRCVRYDLRGCGASEDTTTGGFRHADDLTAVLDGLGIERAAVAGVSMGGRIALDFALDHPERVDRLILISPGLADWDWSATWRRRWHELTHATRGGRLEYARELWFHHPLFATTRRIPALAARLRADIATDTCRVWLDADRETPPRQPHVERLHGLAVPVLLIAGTDDLEDFRVTAGIIAALVADVVRVDLPDTGHLALLERPGDTVRAMSAFLTLQPPRPLPPS